MPPLALRVYNVPIATLLVWPISLLGILKAKAFVSGRGGPHFSLLEETEREQKGAVEKPLCQERKGGEAGEGYLCQQVRHPRQYLCKGIDTSIMGIVLCCWRSSGKNSI